jgi:hypothetical protein
MALWTASKSKCRERIPASSTVKGLPYKPSRMRSMMTSGRAVGGSRTHRMVPLLEKRLGIATSLASMDGHSLAYAAHRLLFLCADHHAGGGGGPRIDLSEGLKDMDAFQGANKSGTQDQLIAGKHGSAKAPLIDGEQIWGLARGSGAIARQEKNLADLRQRFHDEHARHHRTTG